MQVTFSVLLLVVSSAFAQKTPPPDSSFKLCGVYLSMDNSAIMDLVQGTAWEFKYEDDKDNMISNSEFSVSLMPEDRYDNVTCLGKGSPVYKGSDCIRFDNVSISRHKGVASYITWDAMWFDAEDLGELREFASVIMSQLERSFGKPTTIEIPVNKISVSSLAKNESSYRYSSIATWVWKDGRGRKANRLRSIWVAAQRQEKSYKFFVVMNNNVATDESYNLDN